MFVWKIASATIVSTLVPKLTIQCMHECRHV